jgi:hypothetical protein
MSRSALLAMFSAAALSAAACSNSNTTPDPVPDPVVDVFSGTLTPSGGVTHTFVTPRSGSIEARLTTLAPDGTVIIGVALGTWNGSACQIILSNDKATTGSTVTGATSGAGNLCVRVYDVGNVTEPMTYDIQVTHP